MEIKEPHGNDVGALQPLLLVFLSYIVLFIYIVIYRNNFRQVLYFLQEVKGKILWLNNHLFFCLSLIPFATGWVSENHFDTRQVIVYWIILMMVGIADYILEKAFTDNNISNYKLAKSISNDNKGKYLV